MEDDRQLEGVEPDKKGLERTWMLLQVEKKGESQLNPAFLAGSLPLSSLTIGYLPHLPFPLPCHAPAPPLLLHPIVGVTSE